jgi:hypothetical protein
MRIAPLNRADRSAQQAAQQSALLKPGCSGERRSVERAGKWVCFVMGRL